MEWIRYCRAFLLNIDHAGHRRLLGVCKIQLDPSGPAIKRRRWALVGSKYEPEKRARHFRMYLERRAPWRRVVVPQRYWQCDFLMISCTWRRPSKWQGYDETLEYYHHSLVVELHFLLSILRWSLSVGLYSLHHPASRCEIWRTYDEREIISWIWSPFVSGLSSRSSLRSSRPSLRLSGFSLLLPALLWWFLLASATRSCPGHPRLLSTH